MVAIENAISGGKTGWRKSPIEGLKCRYHQHHPGNLLREPFLMGSRKSDSMGPIISIFNKLLSHGIALGNEESFFFFF